MWSLAQSILRRKEIVIPLVIILAAVAVGGFYHIETNRPSTAKASIPFVPVVKERTWNACRSYTIIFEIKVDFGDSSSMRIVEVKTFLRRPKIPWEFFELEIVSMNITLGAEIRKTSTKITLIVHPQKGIVHAEVCEIFDLKIDAKIDVKYMRLGVERQQTLPIQSPPISIEVCG